MLVDVHSHLDYPDLYDRLDEIIANAKKVGVKAVLASGVDPESNKKVLEISKKYDIVEASLGLYPMDAHKEPATFDVEEELQFLRDHKDEFIAVGEIGLDLHHGKDIVKQKEVFRKVLGVAKELDKPVIIHSRKAEVEALDILEESGMKKVVMHSFITRKSNIKRAYELGFYFSIPPAIVNIPQFQEIVKMVDVNHLLTETDAPFLGPYKDKPNEPAFVVETIKKIAEIKGMDEEEVQNNIWMNYQKLFL